MSSSGFGQEVSHGLPTSIPAPVVRDPAEVAQRCEDDPRLPPGTCERVAGYGVMGLTFASGDVLGLRRWTASSVGERFTSIWHRDPNGSWTFYESVRSEIGCTRYFGADVERVRIEPIGLEWEGRRRLHIRTGTASVEWTVELSSTPLTRLMSLVGPAIPVALWRRRPVLGAVGRLAGLTLGAGRVQLTGLTSNEQHFDATPVRICFVRESRAVIEGRDLGPVGPLPVQAQIADFCIPQRGLFAMGRVFVTPIERDRSTPQPA